jgi:6-methylsalicylate decarboxylase
MTGPKGRRTLLSACACCVPQDANLTRRSFINGAAAVGAGAFAATGFGPTAVAQAPVQAKPHRIDVHHHIAPPPWLAAMDVIGRTDGLLANWSVQRSLDDMDKAGVATSMVSPTTPQVTGLGRAAAARIARESNDYANKLSADHPGRFGVFAMLPLPNIDDSLKEVEYAFDTLKVDGVGIMTSYRDKWLGYPEFAPLWEELNRRKATVYTHPTGANCCVNLVQGIAESAVEYGTDTTRTIASLIFSGTSQRYKDINFIFSHGGGVLTAVAERFQIQMVSRPPYRDKFTRDSVDAELKRFYYDTAQVANAVTIGAVAKLVSTSQIVFGSDYPYRTAADHVKGLAAAFSGAELQAIERDNALKILPRLRTA